MKRISLLIAVTFCAAMVSLTGCKKPMINAVNQQTYTESYNKMVQGMSPSKKAELDEAINKIVEAGKKRYFRMTRNVAEANQMAYIDLDELTADQIIQKAKDMDNQN